MGDDPVHHAANLIPYEPTKRMSKLLNDANQIKVLETVPVERYYNTLLQMNKTAQGYVKDQELEKAFILMMRYLNIAFDELPKHKHFPGHRSQAKTEVLLRAKSIIATAADIKAVLRDRYEGEFSYHVARIRQLEEEERRASELKERIEQEKMIRQENARAAMAIQMRNQQNRMQNPVNSQMSLDFLNAAIPSSPQSPISLEQLISQVPTNVTIVIAGDVVDKFLDSAKENTANDIETCGILCGVLCSRKFVVTHVILPKQSGTANSCISEGEEEIFAVQAEKELLTFGWIHTHPSQTAFLSSVDLHTHHAYQSAVNDAVAIVCAPRHNEVGTFVITPQGMQVIGKCSMKGFHPHAESGEQPIFKEASHTFYHQGIKTTIIDIRRKN